MHKSSAKNTFASMRITRFVMKAADMERTFGLIAKNRIKSSLAMYFWLPSNLSKLQKCKYSLVY